MDDLQFNESLDALLAGETLHAETYNSADNNVAYPAGMAAAAATTTTNNFGTDGTEFSPTYSNSEASLSYHNDQSLQHQEHQASSQFLSTNMPGSGTASGQSYHPAAVAAAASFAPFYQPTGYEMGTTAAASSGGASVSSANSRRSRSSSHCKGGGGSVASSSNSLTFRNKRSRDSISSMAVSEDEDDRSKRREDRNLREQQRSQKITQQIDHLREVLGAANIRFKPDKFSTLATVVDYIKQLQQRSTVLDVEHKKLIDTISKTNELVNESHAPPSTFSTYTTSMTTLASSTNDELGISTDDVLGGGVMVDPAVSGGGGGGTILESDMVFAQNLDYKNIFVRCGVPLAVTSIDGRFLDCNPEFEALTGYSRSELLPLELQDALVAVAAASSSASHAFANDELLLPMPDGASSSASSPLDGLSTAASTTHSPPPKTRSSTRNLSLFNLLCRDHMELVFLALSEMLKYAPAENDDDDGTKPSRKDFWNGNVRVNRNPNLEVG